MKQLESMPVSTSRDDIEQRSIRVMPEIKIRRTLAFIFHPGAEKTRLTEKLLRFAAIIHSCVAETGGRI